MEDSQVNSLVIIGNAIAIALGRIAECLETIVKWHDEEASRGLNATAGPRGG